MARVVTFGELLLRLSAPGHERLLQTPRLDAHFGGAEANVAVGLAHWGHESSFVSHISPGPLGDAALMALRAEGIDTQAVARGGARLGLYFAESGAGPRASQVIYDRAGAAIVEVAEEAVANALEGASWLHVTGITAALGPRPLSTLRRGLAAARRAGIITSLDVNYRAALWAPTEAQRTLRPLLRDVDVLIAGASDMAVALGFSVPSATAISDAEGHAAVLAALTPITAELGPKRVAVTFRDGRSASENGLRAALFDADGGPTGDSRLVVGPRHVVPMIDRIGAGDAFAAGLIHGFLERWPADRVLAFATAAGALKHTIPGDWNRVTEAEVERVASGDDDGRVRR